MESRINLPVTYLDCGNIKKQCTTEYCFCRIISAIIWLNIRQKLFLHNQTVSVFLQKQNYSAEMLIFCRKSLFLSLNNTI